MRVQEQGVVEFISMDVFTNKKNQTNYETLLSIVWLDMDTTSSKIVSIFKCMLTMTYGRIGRSWVATFFTIPSFHTAIIIKYHV